jgi:hypothetical protein
MPKKPEDRGTAALSGAATRAKAKAAREDLAANPINWGRQLANIRKFMDDQDRIDAMTRRLDRTRL